MILKAAKVILFVLFEFAFAILALVGIGAAQDKGGEGLLIGVPAAYLALVLGAGLATWIWTTRLGKTTLGKTLVVVQAGLACVPMFFVILA